MTEEKKKALIPLIIAGFILVIFASFFAGLFFGKAKGKETNKIGASEATGRFQQDGTMMPRGAGRSKDFFQIRLDDRLDGSDDIAGPRVTAAEDGILETGKKLGEDAHGRTGAGARERRVVRAFQAVPADDRRGAGILADQAQLVRGQSSAGI